MVSGECIIDLEETVIEEDGTFVLTNLAAPDQFEPDIINFVKTVAGEPEIIETDSGEMIVLRRITGKFDDPDTATGTVKIWLCELSFDEKSKEGIEWKAEWKQP